MPPLAPQRIHPLIQVPSLLIAGNRVSWVERQELNEIVRSGCAEWTGSITVQTERGKITARRAKMRAVSNPSLHGESATMKPSGPTHGPVSQSGYARKLDGFVAGDKKARGLFSSRKTRRHCGGVPHSLTMETTRRAILFMPGEGKVTQYGAARKVKPIRKTSDGWEVGDKTGWTLITEREAQELIANGEGVVRE